MSIGNLKDSGNQGNNFPWQLKVLQGLQAIFDEVAQPLTCVEDSVTICPPAGGLDVNIHDGAGTAITSTTINTTTGLDVNIIGGVTLEVNLDAANDQVGVYGYTNPADPSTYTGIKTDASGVLAIQDNGGSITVDGTVALDSATLTALENITVQNGAGAAAVNIQDGGNSITVDANNLDIRDLTFASDKVDVSGSSITATVTATALDIRALDCGTDSVSICDGTNNLGIDTNGSISSNLYANDLVSGSAELVTTTSGVGYQALDVNVVAPINTITPNILSTIASGTIAASVYSITFFNAGNDTELVSFDSGTNWVNLLPGVTISMDAGGIANKYPAGVFAYDVIASGPIIITYNS